MFNQQQKKQITKRLVIIVLFSVIIIEFYPVWTYLNCINLISIFSREIVQQLRRNACKEECHYRTWNSCYKKDPGK